MSVKNWAKGDNSRSCIQPLKLTQWKGRGREAGFEYPQNTKGTLKKIAHTLQFHFCKVYLHTVTENTQEQNFVGKH